MTTANASQVGGTHYKCAFQHWDLVVELDLGYFEGQITKYITRHRFKKGLEDLQKAMHFTKKLHELALLSGRKPQHRWGTIARMTEYGEANRLNGLELACITSACCWSVVQDLQMLTDRIQRLIDENYPTVTEIPAVDPRPVGEDGPLLAVPAGQGSLFGDAGPGYVNQDR